MPRGPKGEKRPADVIGNAVHVMRIATGEIEDAKTNTSKVNELARLGGLKGGKARATKLTPEQRRESARKAAQARWGNTPHKEEAEYWDSFDSSKLTEEVEVEAVRPKKPLTHTLSVRMEREDMRLLEGLARAQGVGVTTLARMLLRQVLSKPYHQLLFQALEHKQMSEEVNKMMEDAAIPPGGEPVMFVIPKDRLDRLAEVFQKTVHQLLRDTMEKGAGKVSSSDPLYSELKEHMMA